MKVITEFYYPKLSVQLDNFSVICQRLFFSHLLAVGPEWRTYDCQTHDIVQCSNCKQHYKLKFENTKKEEIIWNSYHIYWWIAQLILIRFLCIVFSFYFWNQRILLWVEVMEPRNDFIQVFEWHWIYHKVNITVQSNCNKRWHEYGNA